ncbi:MAG: efflux RND transporter periplasmic adaptor subunit [Paraprevotella sp.]|nr:efflux RND transporter periplasmic adaptor subunit [Paraprevotella sp.]
MKRGIKTIATTAFCCLVALTGCNKQQQSMDTGSYKTMTVKTESRVLQSLYSARIEGRQDVEIYPQVSGTLQRLCVKEGYHVKKGQTLFIIDQVPYQAALNTAEANLKAAQAAEATADLTFKSTKRLFDQKVVSDFDLQKAQNDLQSAKASVAQMQAQVVNAKNNLSYTVVSSPANGVVGQLPYRQGALVSSGIAQPLTTVSDNNELYVYFSMNENDVLNLSRQYGSLDDAAKKMPAVKLILNDGTVFPDSGRVETISGVINTSTGSAQVRAVFPNTSHLLHSGSNGNVEIPVYYNNVIVIPQAATFELQDKMLVYKVVDGKAQSANIEVAPNNNGQEYIVTKGLNVGDVIIAEGAGLVREGTPVNSAQGAQGAQSQGKK